MNIANQLYHKEGTEPVITTPLDFMTPWGEDQEPPEPVKQSAEDMKRMFLGIAEAQNKKVGLLYQPAKRLPKPDKYQGR